MVYKINQTILVIYKNFCQILYLNFQSIFYNHIYLISIEEISPKISPRNVYDESSKNIYIILGLFITPMTICTDHFKTTVIKDFTLLRARVLKLATHYHQLIRER